MPNRHASPLPFDVVVAGAGPVGLMLACELRLAGASVLVLDAACDPTSPLKRGPLGLRGLTLPAAEALERRGLLDEIAPLNDRTPPRRHGGHFAGIAFDGGANDMMHPVWRLPSRADCAGAVEIERVETLLAERALALGAEIRRGAGVEGFTQSEGGVTVYVGGAEIEGGWLVGCDGGRSTVRKLGGFAFEGTEPTFTGYSILVDLADPGVLPLGRHATPTGFYVQPRPGQLGLVEFDGGASHRAGQITTERVEAVLRRVSGCDVIVAALHLATTWTDRARQVPDYRRGRVLLAGDAAHVHAPLGGQGLNLGLGDAANLGWKLAAAARGDAPESLLDTYSAERHPIGAQVLDWSRAQSAVLRPDPQGRALRAIIGDLAGTRDGGAYFADRVSNASLRHDLGGSHPLVGRGVPAFALAGGTTTADHMRDGDGLLIDFVGCATLRGLAHRWGGWVRYVEGGEGDHLGVTAVLVRPDGVVAWATEGDPDSDALVEVAERWFGRGRIHAHDAHIVSHLSSTPDPLEVSSKRSSGSA